MAESEGGCLRDLRRFIVHTPAAWSSAIWAQIHAPILGNEMVSTRACLLRHRSRPIWGMSWLTLSPHSLFLFRKRQECFLTNPLQFRIPERLAPGRFDIWGSSHQIFHVAILCAMYMHVTALLQGFITCHTLDVCQLQGVHR